MMFSIGNSTFQFDQLSSHYAQQALKSAVQSQIDVLCLCKDIDRRRLIISRRGDVYHLKSYQHDGVNHDLNCRFHKPGQGENDQGNTLPAIIHNPENDTLSININMPLNAAAEGVAGTATVGQNQNVNPTNRGSTSLLGLLYRLWHESSLEYYRPDRENSFTNLINKRFYAVLSRSKIKNKPADKAIKTINPDREIPYKQGYLKHVNIDYQMIIGLLDSITPISSLRYDYDQGGNVTHIEGYELKIKGLTDKIVLSVVCYNQYLNFCNHHAAWQFDGERRGEDLIILQYRVDGHKYICHSQLFSMALTDEFVQIDSHYEKQFAEYLTSHKRWFKKPLINDDTETKPDFILRDSEEEVFIEVWGMTGNEAYEARKQAKIDHYAEYEIPLISWHPNDQEPLPKLPEKMK